MKELYAGIMSYRNYNQVYLKHTVPAGLLYRIDMKLCRSCKLSSARYLQGEITSQRNHVFSQINLLKLLKQSEAESNSQPEGGIYSIFLQKEKMHCCFKI